MRKPDARTFGQDLMRGEHIVGGGRVSRKPNAEIAGGGGGAFKSMNAKMAKNRPSPPTSMPAGLAMGEIANYDGAERTITGTSIFDPVLCEMIVRWFCPPKGVVLDPFAGGSVRGVVASRLGRGYVGIELRPEQIVANRSQLHIAGKPKPEWRQGDSRAIAELAGDIDADLVFSCPPFWNLEVYSEDPADLSTLGLEDFFAAQAAIIKAACDRLKENRFAAWVISDVRDKDGFYTNVPGRTVQAFEAAGLRFYNEAILVTAVGSLPVRVRKQFSVARKLGRTHQIVQIYVKGDPRKATKDCGEVEFGDITDTETPPA